MAEGLNTPPVTGENYLAVALNLLAEQKDLSPPLLLALLSLTDLLGILTYINAQVAGPALTDGGSRSLDKQGLVNMLASMLTGSGEGGKKEAIAVLTNLLSAMGSQGGGKKPDFAALMNLLSSLMPSSQEPTKAKYAVDGLAKEVAVSEESGQIE